MRILLADDHPSGAELVVAALEGHDVVVERNGIAALATGQRGAFDVIILDINMPGMTGDQVCRALRAKGVVTPIIALTASVMPEEVDLLRGAGFDSVLEKPIPIRELISTVEHYGMTGQSATR